MTVYAVDLPLRNQDTERQNAPDDCIPDSLASIIAGLTGRQMSGTDVLLLAYPAGYTGFTDPARFAAPLRGLGVQLTYYNSQFGAGGNVAAAIANLKAGRPAVVAIPSDWNANPPTSQFNHMLALRSWDSVADTCQLMNPFHGVYMTVARLWLIDRMAQAQYQGIWVAERINVVAVDTSGLGTGFAAFATAHGLACVSAGEHAYAAGETFAAFGPTAEFPQGVILHYDAKSGVSPNLGPWVAAALWNRGEAIRTAAQQQLVALQAQLAEANATIEQLKATPPAPAPDPQAEADRALGSQVRIVYKLVSMPPQPVA